MKLPEQFVGKRGFEAWLAENVGGVKLCRDEDCSGCGKPSLHHDPGPYGERVLSYTRTTNQAKDLLNYFCRSNDLNGRIRKGRVEISSRLFHWDWRWFKVTENFEDFENRAVAICNAIYKADLELEAAEGRVFTALQVCFWLSIPSVQVAISPLSGVPFYSKVAGILSGAIICLLGLSRAGRLERRFEEIRKESEQQARVDDYSPPFQLNSVAVPEWVVKQDPEEFKWDRVVSLENLDQRCEALRKMGVDLWVQKADPEVLDKMEDYELLEVQIPGIGRTWKCLKMKNPSIGVWHVEGVADNCESVQDALDYRHYGDDWEDKVDEFGHWNPLVLT